MIVHYYIYYLNSTIIKKKLKLHNITKFINFKYNKVKSSDLKYIKPTFCCNEILDVLKKVIHH